MHADDNGQCPDGFYNRSSYCYRNPNERSMRIMEWSFYAAILFLLASILAAFAV
jgi:hypothetical protein